LNELSARKRFRIVSGSFDDYWIRYNWQDVIGSLSGYEIAYPDPPSVRYKPRWLSDHGLRIQAKIFGAPHSPLDLYYNETYRIQVIEDALAEFDAIIWKDLIAQVVLGDEVPTTLYNWNMLNAITSYNDTFHAETGVWIRSKYDNSREKYIFENWIANRTVSGMNYVYDAFKAAYPEIQFGWGTMPTYYYEPKDLKGDFISGGYYSGDFRYYYSLIRHAKLAKPSVPVESAIMGNHEKNNPLSVPFNLQEQFFWTTYFAGGDALYWFDMGNNANWDNIGSEETFEYYRFHSELNRLANTLPVLEVNPLVLEVDTFRGADIGPSAGFREWDSTSQLRASQTDFSFDQYDIIVVEEQFEAIDSFYNKLSSHVEKGGNVVIKGRNVLSELLNVTDEPRTAYLPLENDSSISSILAYDRQLFTLDDNFLGAVIPPIHEVSERKSINFTTSADWTVIRTGMPEEDLGYYPLVLYHNTSDPDSGYILYFGFVSDTSVEDNPVDKLYASLMYQFAGEFLGLDDLVPPKNHPEWIITTGLDDLDHTVIGVIPDDTGGEICLKVNATRRQLPLENTYFYEGFAESMWLGEIDQQLSGFYATVPAHEPRRWVLTAPETEHDVHVHVIYPETEPIIAEPFPLSISVLETLDRQDMDDFSIELTLPENITLSEGSPPAKQSLSTLKAMKEEHFYWLVEASEEGRYTLAVKITSPDLEKDFTYEFTLRVNPGRIEIDLPEKISFTLDEELYITGSLVYQGKEAIEIDIAAGIQDYVWGNPGGPVKTISLSPGESYSFQYYFVGVQGHRVGEIANFGVSAVSTEGTVYAEDYGSIEILLVRESPVTDSAASGFECTVVILSGSLLYLMKRRRKYCYQDE
ncbi:MAG: hypothetical protein ACFFD4_32975, partial [Candidatus Odinarchaeota archaeon]